jgi:hypothetical protein
MRPYTPVNSLGFRDPTKKPPGQPAARGDRQDGLPKFLLVTPRGRLRLLQARAAPSGTPHNRWQVSSTGTKSGELCGQA